MTTRVLKPGMLTTVQDLGRFGYAHLGISPAGAADSLSFRMANLLVGNDENAPALEMTLLGASLQFTSSAVVAVAGAQIQPASGIPIVQAVEVPAGFVLECGSLSEGARTYLAVQGGFRVPRVMGSASTLLAGGFGGFRGRQVLAGDVLEIDDERHPPVAFRPELLERLQHGGPLRITKGVQWDWFEADARQRFLESTYTVSAQSNRAGIRLNGDAVVPRDRTELLTEGVTLGSIQAPPDGQPIILFVDQQTTGGYPKIANVISADVHRLGQLRPGDPLRFELVSVEQAVRFLREQEQLLREAFAR